MSVLERIHSPADVKLLDKADTAKLAAEMRHVIIQTVARNAGHLAPNLGVVELTLALHRVFDSPRDKIIWDVGHQSEWITEFCKFVEELKNGSEDRQDEGRRPAHPRHGHRDLLRLHGERG